MSRVLLLLSSWLVLFTCASAQRSCRGRCGESYFRGNECQCDYECLSHNECCRSFESECTTRGSCKGRCGERFKRGRQCNCDVQCLKYNQCCPDYESQCVVADYSMEEETEEQEVTPTEEDMANEDFYGSETRDTEGTVSGNDRSPLDTPPDDRSVLVETTPGGTTPGGTTPGGTTPGGTTPGGTTPSRTEEATERTTDPETPPTSATTSHPEANSTGPVTTLSPPATRSDSNTGSTPDSMTTTALSASSETVPQLSNTTSQSTSEGASTSPTSESGVTTSAVGNTESMVSSSTSAPTEPSEMSSEMAATGPADQTPGTSLQTTSEPTTLVDDLESSPDKSTPVSSAMTVSTEAASETQTSTPTAPLTTQGPGSTPQTATTTITTTPSTPAYNDDRNAFQTTEKADITDLPTVPATTPSVKTQPTTLLPNKVPEKPNKPKEPSNGLNENSFDVQSDANYDPNLCSGNPVNGLTTLRNGTVMVFRGHFFWVLDSRRQPGQAQSIRDVWGIPSPIDTVFTRCNCKGKTYFFKEGKYWRFENDVMDDGFPKLISDGFGLRGHINAALSMPKYRSRRESVFFFKPGGLAQRYTYRVTPTCHNKSPVMKRHSRAAEPELGLEISLKTLRGFPSSVTSAISVPSAGRGDYKYYIFSQTKYYNLKMEGETPLVLTPRGGPEKQKPAKSWFRCPKK